MLENENVLRNAHPPEITLLTVWGVYCRVLSYVCVSIYISLQIAIHASFSQHQYSVPVYGYTFIKFLFLVDI